MKKTFVDEYDAAAHVDMSVGFLRAGRVRGVLGGQTPAPPHHKIGTAVRYTIEDLDAWLAERRVDPGARLKQSKPLKFATRKVASRGKAARS